MTKNRRQRRYERMKKLRRERRIFFLVVMAVMLLVAHSAFSKDDVPSEKYCVQAVTVESGDTLWTIASEYKPEGKDLREFVYELADNNGVPDCNIYCGQTIYVPILK